MYAKCDELTRTQGRNEAAERLDGAPAEYRAPELHQVGTLEQVQGGCGNCRDCGCYYYRSF